jgi:hypothetical protein
MLVYTSRFGDFETERSNFKHKTSCTKQNHRPDSKYLAKRNVGMHDDESFIQQKFQFLT